MRTRKIKLLIAVCAIFLLSFGSLAAAAVLFSIEADRPLAMVRRFKPLVVVKDTDSNEWLDARRAQPLFSSDTLRTGEDGYAEVQFMDNSIARLKPNTVLVVTGNVRDANSTSARMSVDFGEIYLNVTGRQSNYDVATPTAVAAVKGTSFISEVAVDGSSTFTGLSGEIEITAINSGQQALIGRRNRAFVESTGNVIDVTEITEQELEDSERTYEEFQDSPGPEILRFRFRNSDGQVRDVEIEYYEN